MLGCTRPLIVTWKPTSCPPLQRVMFLSEHSTESIVHLNLTAIREPASPVPAGPTSSLTLRLLSQPAAMILGSWDCILISGPNGNY